MKPIKPEPEKKKKNVDVPTMHLTLFDNTKSREGNTEVDAETIDVIGDAKGKIEEIKQQLAYKIHGNKYLVDEEIGRGGMGVVYSTINQELCRREAMKILLNPSHSEHHMVRAYLDFLKETLITSFLDHPNIVTVHDLGLENDSIFFTMKLIEGEDLYDILGKIKDGEEEYIKKYSRYNLLTIFRKVCDAVGFAHSKGVIHRDIKPHNIMTGPFGEVVLMDWGLAEYIGDDPESPLGQFDYFITKGATGTLLYMAPEQVSHPELVDYATDIYLLGSTLYHIITLEPPHTGFNEKQILENIAEGRVMPPDRRAPHQQISRELGDIILRAMAKDKKDRYQSVAELCSDLDALMDIHINSVPLEFKSGEYLMRQGEIGTKGYVLINGKVDVYRKFNNKSFRLTSMGPGDVVGEMAIISSDERSADVVASENTEVVEIDGAHMARVLKNMPPWMSKVVYRLVERLRKANNRIHKLSLQVPDYHILKQLTALCSLEVCEQQLASIEELTIDLEEMKEEIAFMLCIEEQNVAEILQNLINTELCETIQERKFRIVKFKLLCCVTTFLGNLLETREYDISSWDKEIRSSCEELVMKISPTAAKIMKIEDF